MSSTTGLFVMTAKAHFTNDLPNGPYATQSGQRSVDVFLPQSRYEEGGVLLVEDIKAVIEAFAAKTLAQQAENMPSYVRMNAQWQVLREYKGGELSLKSPVSPSTMQTGDSLTCHCKQWISMGPACCTIM